MAEEHFSNDFVVKVESGHPGYIAYSVIATPMTWRKLIDDLNGAVKTLHSTQKSKNADGEIELVSRRATISRGKSSHVSISFVAAEDLSNHHVGSTLRSNLSCWIKFCVIAGILVLALIGISALVSGFKPW